MKELEPVDLERCQAEMSNGISFMTLGGQSKMVRCPNKPTDVMVEKYPGEDSQFGAMSVCPDCLHVALDQLDVEKILVQSIDEYIKELKRPWKPIATAPWDTEVLVRGKSGYMTKRGEFIINAYRERGWHAGRWNDLTGTPLEDAGWVPTAWRPIEDIL